MASKSPLPGTVLPSQALLTDHLMVIDCDSRGKITSTDIGGTLATNKDDISITVTHITAKQISRSLRPCTGNNKPHKPTRQEETDSGTYTSVCTAAEFYHVDRMRWEDFISAVASGSELATWVNSYNRCPRAPETSMGDDDGDKTRTLEPLHLDVELREREDEIRKGTIGKTMPKLSIESPGQTQGALTSLFDHSDYPPSWPLIPFSQKKPQYLEYRIPHHLLPKSLVVHDPWNMLAVDSRNEHGYAQQQPSKTWTDVDDITHIYDLTLCPESQAHSKIEDAGIVGVSIPNENRIPEKSPRGIVEAKKEQGASNTDVNSNTTLTVGDALKIPSGYLFYPENAPPGPIYPPIFVIFDLPSRESLAKNPTLLGIDTAHLYISPNLIGQGHHSSVVDVELELPRSAIVRHELTDYRPKLCVHCIQKDLRAILEDLDGKNGEKMANKWKKKSATLKRTFIPDGSGIPGKGEYVSEAKGPVRPVRITLRLHDHNAKECEYASPPPPSTRVRVVAKLSKISDGHLDREAKNYQAFPQHIFEHQSGTYTFSNGTISVPMGAVVPQFYGYYTPREQNAERGHLDDCLHQTPGHYLSRILLLEDCGQQIPLDELTMAEKKECASLVSRFHDAGWSHESVFQRNFVYQKGPLQKPLSTRTGRIFRLLDFGRSSLIGQAGALGLDFSRQTDDAETETLFGVRMSRSAGNK